MQYNFFACRQDKIDVLDYLLRETDLQIFDSYSPYGQEVRQFRTLDEISEAFDWEKEIVTLKLWSPSFKGHYKFRKINLNPRSCNGYEFRYCIEGWGLIQISFGIISEKLLQSTVISHFTEKGAQRWETSGNDKGPVSDWDWASVNSYSRKLKYHIHKKMAVRLQNGSAVLPEAARLEKEGLIIIR